MFAKFNKKSYLKLRLFSSISLIILLFFIFLFNPAYADSNTIQDGGTTTDQQNLDGNGEILTVKSNSTLATGATTPAANVTGDSVSVTVESGSTISANTQTVFGDTTSDLSVTNSGTITASGTTAIDAKATTDATITNNSGGTISSNRNTIRISKTGGTNTTGMTIINSGKITATNGSAIFGTAAGNTATITNKAGGEMTNSDSDNATIRVGVNSNVTNSGSIKNDVGYDSIKLYGNNSTITLKDGGIVVGKIAHGAGITGSTLKMNHGVGQAYYYDIDGDFSFEDLDGNQVVKGSAGSVGQGGSETIDEMLSYKSINLRNFLNRYENSNLFNHKGGWGELYSTLLNRSEDSNSLAMEYNLINLGANLIYPLENSNFIMMFEGGIQDFAKDYRITYQNISGGIHIPDNDKFFNLDTFITGGVTLKDGKRKVLTNTVSSGTVDSDSNFQTYDIQLGAKKNNLNIIPDIGFTSSMSITPTYDESKFYSWRNRVVGNLSIYLSDDYLIRDDKEEKLNLNWALDLRSAIGDDEQTYSISGTTATYKQDNDLKREISLSASMNYEKYIYENSKIGVSYYGLLSSQNTLSLGGNAFYKMNF